MPYIVKSDREKFDQILTQMPEMTVKGELEYCIFKLMKQYMANKKVSYSELHSTVYAAIHCGDEFRRLYLDKRENEAKESNGEVIAY